MSAPPPPPSNSNTPAAPLPPSLGAPDRSPPVAPASPPVMPSGSPPSPPAASPPAPPDPPPVTTPPVAPLPTLPPPTPPPVMPVPVVPAPSPPAPRMPSKPVKPVQPSSPPPVVQPPSPSPPLTPQPPTLSPPPPVMPVLTPTPSPPSPVNPLPPTPSPPPPVNPLPPTTSPPSPVNALPPAPSPPSPVNPLPPTTSPPSPVNPLPPAPSSPPSPAPPTTPSQPPAAAPSPTTTPPPNPLPPAGSPPAPSPATPIPSPPVFTASPPGGATPSPPASTSPPSRSSPPSSRPSPRSPPPSSTPQGVVIAIVAAIVALLVLGLVAGMLCFCSRRRRLRRRRRASAPPDGIYRPRLPVTSHQQSPFIKPIPYTPQLHAHSPLLCSSSDPPPPPPPPPPSSPPPVSSGTVSYADLEAATNGFSEGNLLGQGGFGHVYHGKLLLHGREQEVAIKKLRPGSGQGEREFRAEVGIISRVHHRNLVSLVGYCIHNDQRLLIYEYVPNKTLDYHLHGRDRTSLDWARRWKIAVGSAKGLVYLHEDCRPKIIHRDIKAANILLDFKFEPKVADFGLAKIQPGDDTHVSTRVMGTFGYLAPEYATTGKVNDRSDVFSFGVVLLELITGRRPVISTEPYNDETLVSWARPLLTKDLEEHVYDELVDPKLGTLYDAHDMQRLISCAAAAVRHTARSRPRMTQIVRYLEGELSIEDLNAGVAPGQSSLRSQEHSGDTTELMQRRFRKVVFPPGTGAVIDSDYLSEVTSEYGVDPSISSSSGGDDDSGEVVGSATVTQTATSRPHAASIPDTAELAARHSGETATAKPMSRRTRPSRLP